LSARGQKVKVGKKTNNNNNIKRKLEKKKKKYNSRESHVRETPTLPVESLNPQPGM
jgi:hypothetical protein